MTVTLLDEKRAPVLHVDASAAPSQRSGSVPTLAAKGGGEVAMEELHFVAERIDFQST